MEEAFGKTLNITAAEHITWNKHINWSPVCRIISLFSQSCSMPDYFLHTFISDRVSTFSAHSKLC